MDQWIGKVAVVTGASSGIGAALAETLVNYGLKVVGLARRSEKIEELAKSLASAKGKLYAVRCDLSKEEDILKAFEWTERELGGVDVLVNNAGVAYTEQIIDGSTESFRKIMDINVIAVAVCSREAVRSLKKRNARGHIIMINSLAGHFAESIRTPMSLYPASKYAVTAMSHALRHEMSAESLNVRITSISPGLVETEMSQKLDFPKEILQKLPTLKDKDVVEAVVYALSAPPRAQVCEVYLAPYSPDFKVTESPWSNPQTKK